MATTRFSPPELHKTVGYSHVAEARGGRLVYIAGQVALDASGTLVGAGNFKAQVEQVFENLGTALRSAGARFEDVVKLNTYCVETVPPGEIAAFREVRDRFVPTAEPPASTFVFVSRLVHPDWLVEVEAVAAPEGASA
jgi:enamine deaminase RidA (YjgF/YER057c/UK114 family)